MSGDVWSETAGMHPNDWLELPQSLRPEGTTDLFYRVGCLLNEEESEERNEEIVRVKMALNAKYLLAYIDAPPEMRQRMKEASGGTN